MATIDPTFRAQRMRAGWRSLHGADLFRAVVGDLVTATAATSGDLLLHGRRRPVLGAATDSAAAELDLSSRTHLSPGCQVLLRGRIVSIADTLDCADERDPWCALAVASDVASVLSVPLLSGPDVVAALTAFSDTPDHFIAERVEFAAMVADEAAPVVLTELLGAAAPAAADGGHFAGRSRLRTMIGVSGGGADRTGLRLLRGAVQRQAHLVLVAGDGTERPRRVPDATGAPGTFGARGHVGDHTPGCGRRERGPQFPGEGDLRSRG